MIEDDCNRLLYHCYIRHYITVISDSLSKMEAGLRAHDFAQPDRNPKFYGGSDAIFL